MYDKACQETRRQRELDLHQKLQTMYLPVGWLVGIPGGGKGGVHAGANDGTETQELQVRQGAWTSWCLPATTGSNLDHAGCRFFDTAQAETPSTEDGIGEKKKRGEKKLQGRGMNSEIWATPRSSRCFEAPVPRISTNWPPGNANMPVRAEDGLAARYAQSARHISCPVHPPSAPLTASPRSYSGKSCLW